MHGDFSKLVHQHDKRYSTVLAQQGRLQLDSDMNAKTLIDLYHARTLATDLIGPHGGPAGRLGFGIGYVTKKNEPADLTISPGHYYVDGIMVDATRPAAGVPVEGRREGAAPETWTYWDQPDAFRDKERPETDNLPDKPFLVYLKVTERLVTYLQDPRIRETALGPTLPDTAAWVKVTWQVLHLLGGADGFDEWVRQQAPTARLAARTEKPAKADDNPCLAAPDARYRGPENQLYRVEVHAVEPDLTFKWSRENGSVVFGIASIAGTVVTLTGLGRDGKLDLDVGDWVEILDDAAIARNEPADLLRVTDIDTERLRVELAGERASGIGEIAARHPFLRRWDHQATNPVGGAVPLARKRWVDLEDGVQVWFDEGGHFSPGDFWLIPARTLTGDVEWPQDEHGNPLLRTPHGVIHHYAPLATVNNGKVQELRRAFTPLAVPLK
jgi:hypothetical protein